VKVFSLILLICSIALSEDFESLRKEYSSLRNADSGVLKVKERKDLASRLLSLETDKENERVLALTYAAVLFAEISTKEKKELNQRKARDTLQKLELEFPNHELLDDAYFAVAVLLPEREIIFERILRDFPDSDTALKIKAQSSYATAGDLKPVIIDPGHGGEDLGAIGSSGVYEKDIVLDIAERVTKIIPATLTRNSDVFIPLEKRMELARNSELFISIHTNSHQNNKLNGIEVFYFGSTKDATVNALAARENSSDLADLLGSPDERSKKLAETINRKLKKLDWKNRGVKEGPFFILSGLTMPAILLELGFLSNQDDEEKLLNEEERQRLANSIAEGIREFLSEDK
jgi:N-acetylmuramoyl-L-alanine amidase